MPNGPNAEKRPADVIGAAVKVANIAAGEIEEDKWVSSAAAEMGRRGGEARARSLSAEQRAEITRKAAAVRYEKKK